MLEYKETNHSLMYKANSDLTFYSAGRESCSPGWGYGPRVRAYHVIHFVLDGEGTFQINEHTYHISKGDVFVCPAGRVTYYEADKEHPWTYIWVNFLGIQSQNMVYRLLSTSAERYVLRGLPLEKYEQAVSELLAIQEDTMSSYLLANSILLRIMSWLFADTGFQEQEQEQPNTADRIRFYLDMNYSRPLRMKEVAAKFGYHPHYITRIFNERFGVPPKQYLFDLKLKKACGLLRSTELPVSVIAASLGFEDALGFSKLFKKTFGISPTQYRKNNAEKK